MKTLKAIEEDYVRRFVDSGDVLDLLGNWRGASFAVRIKNGLSRPGKGAPQ
jgi:hypothetical protein